MGDLVPVQEKLIPVTLNLTEGCRDFMRVSAASAGRSMSNWLRRVLEGMIEGRVGVVGGGASAAPAASRPVISRAAAAPEGEGWVLVVVTAADVGKEAWMDARAAGVAR